MKYKKKLYLHLKAKNKNKKKRIILYKQFNVKLLYKKIKLKN